MHSPWGLFYQLVKETGWTRHEILWKVTHANMMLMMADRPSFRRQDEDEAIPDSGSNLAKRFKARKATSKTK